MHCLRALALVLFLASPSHAQELPGFERDTHVRTWPAGFVPPALGEVGIARLETALRGLRYPFYVLLYETLPAGPGDEDARARALTDGAAAAWAPHGYDPALSSVFALTFSPRKFSLLVGGRWQAELGLRDAEVDRFIEHFLARVRGTPSDPVGGIIDMAQRLDAHVFERTDPERIAAARRTMIFGFIAAAAVMLLLFTLVLFFIRRAQLRRRRDAFGELVRPWEVKISNAAGRYVEFYGKRDGILGLLELEGKTAALLEQVTGEVDAIYTSVAAMDAHVKTVSAQARSAHWFRLKPIDRALVALGAPFEFDTGVLNEADLFGPATKHLRIDPSTLEAELEARFASSLVGWKRLESAADLRFHDAAALLPHTLMDDVLARAAEHRLPARWFAEHPLFGDAESDRALWAATDALRWKDAIAFFEAIEELRGRHGRVAALLERLVAVREEVAAVRLAALPAFPGGTLFAAVDDPADTIESARGAEADLERHIVAGGDIAAVESACATAAALYRKTRQQIALIEDAVRSAADDVAAAERQRSLSAGRIADALELADKAASQHLDTGATSFLRVAERRLDVGDAELALAKHKLVARYHLDARRTAASALATFNAASEEAERCVAHVALLETQRLTYEQRIASLPELRQRKLAELHRYDRDKRINEWSPVEVTGPADFGALTSALDQKIEEWSAIVRRTRSIWEDAERARHAAEVAERFRESAAFAAARAGATSWAESSSASSSGGVFSSAVSAVGSWASGGSSSRSGDW